MKFSSATLLSALLLAASAAGSVIYTYDFPGTPGSGLAANQTNPQTPNATFSNFTRMTNVAANTANVFDGSNWSTISGALPDPANYDTFTLTSATGYHLDLSGLTFQQNHGPGGPTKGRVALYLNGSSTSYAFLDYNPASSLTTTNFAFTPTTDAQNITTAEFRFFAWNSGNAAATMEFDNVATTVAIVPEPAALVGLLALIPLAIFEMRRWRQRIRAACPGPNA